MDRAHTAGTLLNAGCSGTITLAALYERRRSLARRSQTAAAENMRTAVALGSNLGDRLNNLRAALDAILQLSNVSPPIVSSPVYETEPIDCEAGAGKFLNAVVEFEYQSDPAALLDQLIGIEEALGRKRDHPRNISRIIDIDLLYCGDRQIDNGQLHLPHPRIHSRKFVLKPLADIRPHLVLPDGKKTVSELLTTFDESRDVVRFPGGW